MWCLFGGDDGIAVLRLMDCMRVREKFDSEELKILDEIMERYAEQGWLSKDDIKRLKVLWEKV